MGRRQRYPELALTARMIASSGYLAITVGVISGVTGAYFAYQNGNAELLLGSVAWGLAGVFYGVLTIAASQVIRLLMDIEENTRPKEPTAMELLDGD